VYKHVFVSEIILNVKSRTRLSLNGYLSTQPGITQSISKCHSLVQALCDLTVHKSQTVSFVICSLAVSFAM